MGSLQQLLLIPVAVEATQAHLPVRQCSWVGGGGGGGGGRVECLLTCVSLP